MIKHTLIIAIFFIHSFLFSQKTKTNNITTTIKEKILLQTNTDFYLSGENILYKTICFNEANENTLVSKIVYIELINNDNVSIIKHKQIIRNGISFNDFFIPTNFETGNYKIIAYTNLTLNNNNYASKEVFILNPYTQFPEKYKEKTTSSEAENLITTKEKHTTSSKIKLNKNEFNKREKVSVEFIENLKGNFIFNVVKIDSVPILFEQKNSNIFESAKTNILDENKNLTLFPETRGEVFFGKITSKNNEDNLENKKIALSIPGKNFDFKIASTDKDGKFNFLLDAVSENEAFFQVFEKNKEDYQIELLENPTLRINNPEKSIKINPNYANSFLKRSIANQIQNAYYHTKSDTIFAHKKIKPFYDGSDKEYILKDYNQQNTVKEIFIEIIPEVYISKEKGKQTFNVNDYEVNSSDIYLNTLVLIDGFLLQDVDEIITYDPSYFEKINFVNKGYFLNKYIFNGVVNLITKEYNYVPKIDQNYIIKKKIERPQLQKKYYSIDYSKQNFEKIPDYRYQLCWEPNITEISNQKPLEFYTSDIPGNYKIQIEGITKNGEPILIENYIQVK